MDAPCPNCQNILQLGIAHFTDEGEPAEMAFPSDVSRIDVGGFGACHHCLTVLHVSKNVVSAATQSQLDALDDVERENLQKILGVLMRSDEHIAWAQARLAFVNNALEAVLDENKVQPHEAMIPLTILLARATAKSHPELAAQCFLRIATAMGQLPGFPSFPPQDTGEN